MIGPETARESKKRGGPQEHPADLPWRRRQQGGKGKEGGGEDSTRCQSDTCLLVETRDFCMAFSREKVLNKLTAQKVPLAGSRAKRLGPTDLPSDQ